MGSQIRYAQVDIRPFDAWILNKILSNFVQDLAKNTNMKLTLDIDRKCYSPSLMEAASQYQQNRYFFNSQYSFGKHT